MLIASVFLFGSLALANLVAALRAGGPVGRALAAGGWAALLTGLPLAAALFSWRWAGLEDWELTVGLALVLAQAVVVTRFLIQPFRHAELVEEPALVKPLGELAARAGLARRPSLLRHRTLGALPAYAWVVRVQHPVVVLADGVVHRLESPQVAAVIAHEVAHIATGSLWWLALPAPLAATFALLLLPWIGPFGALTLSWALGLGSRRLVSRRTELLCDRRSGELTSPEAMREALRRMHALHPMREQGWRGELAWGVASHPHVSERLRALGGEDSGEAANYARASRLAFAIWAAALLLGGLPLALLGAAGGPVAAAVWVLVALTLALSGRLGTRSTLRRRCRLVPRGLPGRRAKGVGAVLLALGFALAMASMVPCVSMTSVVLGLGLLGFGLLRAQGAMKLREKVVVRLQHQDLEGAYRLGSKRQRALRRDPAMCLDWALVAIACGYRQDGIAALEELVERAPRLVLAPLNLGGALLGERPERSLELGTLAVARAPGEPLGFLLQVRALRRLGRTEEALLAWKAASELPTEEPAVLVQAAELALDRGETEAAAAWLVQAREHSPGDLGLLLAEVRLALAQGDCAAAAISLARAEALRADSPFVFVGWRLAELRATLEDPDGGC